MFKMKALRDFRGKPGEGIGTDRRHVETGSEFSAADAGRARDLESRGLAVPASGEKAETVPRNKMEPPLQNKAADAGPLPLAGGETGEQSGFASLSGPARVRPPRASRKPRGEPE